MIRKDIKVILCVFCVSIFLGISVGGVLAADVESPWGYFGPYLDYSYRNLSYANNHASFEYGSRMEVYPLDDGPIPVGYAGIMTRLYDSEDNLAHNSEWLYLEHEVNSFSYGYSPAENFDSKGYYYSKGLTAAYNGDGYEHYTTFKSPNIYYPGY